jgi:hypothetical protein
MLQLKSHHQANYWTMYEVHQVKVHIFGTPKYLQQWENVGTNEVDIYKIIYIKKITEINLMYYELHSALVLQLIVSFYTSCLNQVMEMFSSGS